MSSEEVLLLNVILYTVTLFYFYFKYKLSVGVFLWILYTLSAWSSFLFVQQPLYASSAHASTQTLLPCFYLYVIFVIAMTPLMKLKKIESIDSLNHRLLIAIMVVCSLIQVLFFIVDIPAMLNVMRSGSGMLSELRSTVYGDDGLSAITKNVWLNKISLLYSGIRIFATGLSVIMFIAYNKHRRLVTIFAVSALLNNLRIIIVQVGRGEMVFVFLLYACTIYLMRDWLSAESKRKVVMISIPVILIGGTFFTAITLSRFGDKAAFFMYKYLGEPINNFDGILFNNIKGTTNGRAYFSTIYRYIFGESGIITADEKWSLIQSQTGIRGDIFYTWVGGLIIEFGKVVPFIVAFVLNRGLKHLAAIRHYYIGDLIVLIFFMNFYIRGIFIFPTQNIEGTLMILYTILLYLIFRIRKNQKGHLVFILPRKRLDLGEDELVK